jgi:hypothetical protein
MSGLHVGPAFTIIDGEIGGWIERICAVGAQETIDNAKRDGVTVPVEQIAEVLADLRRASRIANASVNANGASTWTANAGLRTASNAGDVPRPLTTCDAADRLGLSTARVRQLAIAGRFGTKVGNAWTFRPEEIDEYANP